MSTNFHREGLGFIPNGKKNVDQKQKKSTYVASSSKSKYVDKSHAHTTTHKKATKASTSKSQYAGKRNSINHVHHTHMHKSFNTHLTCYFCGKIGHIISNYHAKKNLKTVRSIWIPKHLIFDSSNANGPKRTWVPQVTK